MPLTPNAGPAKPYPLETQGESVKFSMTTEGRAQGTRSFFLASSDLANYADILLGNYNPSGGYCYPDVLPYNGIPLFCESVEFEPFGEVPTCDSSTGFITYPDPSGAGLDPVMMKGTAKYREATAFNNTSGAAIPLYEESLVPWSSTTTFNPKDGSSFFSVETATTGGGASAQINLSNTASTPTAPLVEGFDSIHHTLNGFYFDMKFRRRVSLPAALMSYRDKVNSNAVKSLEYGITFPPESLLITDIKPRRYTRPGGGFLWDVAMTMRYIPTAGFGPTATYSAPPAVVGGWNQHYNPNAVFTADYSVGPNLFAKAGQLCPVFLTNNPTILDETYTFAPVSFSFLTGM